MLSAKEYLRQAYRLDQQIESCVTEIQQLRALATSVGSLQYGQCSIQKTPSTEASFVKALERVWELEEKNQLVAQTLVRLERVNQVHHRASRNPNERLILSYRYLQDKTWEDIASSLYIDERTARRWHGRALQNVIVPEDAIVLPHLKSCPQMSETATVKL